MQKEKNKTNQSVVESTVYITEGEDDTSPVRLTRVNILQRL